LEETMTIIPIVANRINIGNSYILICRSSLQELNIIRHAREPNKIIVLKTLENSSATKLLSRID
jgi:hypothetical protein